MIGFSYLLILRSYYLYKGFYHDLLVLYKRKAGEEVEVVVDEAAIDLVLAAEVVETLEAEAAAAILDEAVVADLEDVAVVADEEVEKGGNTLTI